MQSNDPLTVQLACMDAETVFEVIKLLTGTMAQTVRSRSRARVWRFGAWVWGVLGKCKDRTELGSEEVAILRELGKRAVGLAGGIRKKAGKSNNDSQKLSGRWEEDPHGSLPLDEPATGIAAENTGDAELTLENGEFDLDEPANDKQGPVQLEEAKKRLKGCLSEANIQSPSTNAVTGDASDSPGFSAAQNELDVDRQIAIILDMILTVVGEFYGQRDLLGFRDIWGEGMEC